MEEILDNIFSCGNGDNGVYKGLISCIDKWFSAACGRNRDLFRRRMELECENLLTPVFQENSDNENMRKRRAMRKYSELSFHSVINILAQVNKSTDEYYRNNVDLLIELLVLVFSSKNVIINKFGEESFLEFISSLSELLSALMRKEGSDKVSQFLVSMIFDLSVEVTLRFEQLNDSIFGSLFSFFKEILSVLSLGVDLEAAVNFGGSQMKLFRKVIVTVSPGKANELIQTIIEFSIDVICSSYDGNLKYAAALLENILIQQLLSLQDLLSLLCTRNINQGERDFIEEGKSEMHLVTRTSLVVGFINTILEMLFKNKDLVNKLTNSGGIDNVLNSIILEKTLGLMVSDKKISIDGVPNEIDECYIETLISGGSDFLTVLQRIFSVFPSLLSLSRSSVEKMVKHLYGILEMQEQDDKETELKENSFSQFSILFPLLCETCCSANVRLGISLASELLVLFETVAKRINAIYSEQEESLFSFLMVNQELLSIIHIPSFTYLLLLDIHLFAQGNVVGGKFLFHFLTWCSKYEENYILYYTAYCITSRIKILAEDGSIKENSWLGKSIKFLFYIMINYSFANDSSKYCTSNKYGGKSTLISEFIRRPVLSNKQTYCFICTLNIISAMCEIDVNIPITYFKEEIDKVGGFINSIIEGTKKKEVALDPKVEREENGHRQARSGEGKQCFGSHNDCASLAHLRCIFLFLPFLNENRGIIKTVRNLFARLIELTTRFNSEMENRTLPGVDLEAYLCNWVITLLYALSMRNTLNQISGYDEYSEEDEVESEEGIVRGRDCGEERRCVAYKIFREEMEKTESCFTKISEFYRDKSKFSDQYIDSFSVFSALVENVGLAELRIGASDKKIQKYANTFGREKMTVFYKMVAQKERIGKGEQAKLCTSIRCLLSILRHGVLGSGSVIHSIKCDEIIGSLKSLEKL